MLGCLNDMQIHVLNVKKITKIIWNVYFAYLSGFHQTQNEFKEIILFFRNFNRKYIEKKIFGKISQMCSSSKANCSK